MTRSLDDNTDYSTPDRKLLMDVQAYGWHVTGVFAKKGGLGPGYWAYSIGLFHSFGHPEVIVYGLKLENCMDVINEIGRQVKMGKHFEITSEYKDILTDPYQCAFRLVQLKCYGDYLGTALWFYESDSFPAMQCFWPDNSGKLPWDEECSPDVRTAQPFLFIP
jgi:hypothetical protein